MTLRLTKLPINQASRNLPQLPLPSILAVPVPFSAFPTWHSFCANWALNSRKKSYLWQVECFILLFVRRIYWLFLYYLDKLINCCRRLQALHFAKTLNLFMESFIFNWLFIWKLYVYSIYIEIGIVYKTSWIGSASFKNLIFGIYIIFKLCIYMLYCSN